MAVFAAPIRKTATIALASTSVDFSIKIPGTYAGLNPADLTIGVRFFKSAQIWAVVPTGAEYVENLKLTDTDGIIPSGDRPALPNYPDVLRLYDSTDTANDNGAYLPLLLEAFDLQGNKAIRPMISETYITGTIHGAALQVFRINIMWGRWLNSP